MSEPELRVHGGAGGTYAQYEDLATLARHSDDVAAELGGISAACHAILADPDVLASAVLNPGGVAAFEAKLLVGLDGPRGLTALSVGFAERSLALRLVAASYQAMDEAQAMAIDQLRWAAGYAFGAAAMASPAAVLLAAGSAGTWLAAYQLAGGELDVPRLLTEHPGVVDHLVGAGPGLITALPGTPIVGDVSAAAHLIGLLYPDGTPGVTDGGIDTSHPAMFTPPNDFEDLISGLDHRNTQSPPGQPDQIDVRVITHPDGSKAYLVDIPGTKVWNPPLQHSSALNDLGTNIEVMAGDLTARQQAIAEALRRAGASATDPVMLVGHSQGGMVAAQAAHDSRTERFDFNVTHVVTVGSPVGRVDIPDHTQMLSLENAHDVVPHLDAAENRDRPNITTVTFDTQYGDIGQNHNIGASYLPAAQALDQSTDATIQAYRASAGAFLDPGDGSTVQTHVYHMTRNP